jgi:hypothetical protein
MWACLMARISNTLNGALVWIGVFGVALLIGLIFAAITGEWGAFLAFAFVVGALLASIILTLITFDVIMCAVSQLNLPPPASGSSGGPLTGEVDCPTAQSSLAEAKARLALLQIDMDVQAAKVRAAQDALANARTALTVATAALAASFFFPWAIFGAVAAVAAAVYLATRAAQSLAAESASLQQIAAQLSRAQRDVSASEVMVAQSCATTVVPGPTVGGITVGALSQLAGAH